MRIVIVDGCKIANREELHKYLAWHLRFPLWYGNNLDALHDLLTDITADTTLRLENWADAETALGPYGSRAEKVLATCALENPSLTIEFC